MDASAPLDTPAQPTIDVIVRLADEGIPVRAIARATHVASSDVYDLLRDAVAAGSIIELPKDDWPPGSVRSERAVFAGTNLDQEDALRHACIRFFATSPQEGALLATLLKRNEVTKEQLHLVVEQYRPCAQTKEPTEIKIVDVLICRLRKKIMPHGIAINTLWGRGYHISTEHRERAVKLLSAAGTA